MPAPERASRIAAVLLVLGAGPGAAQSLSVSVNPVIIIPPTEAQYDAGAPGNVTSSTSFTMTLDCPNTQGNHGCEIDWSYSGVTLQLEYQVTAASGCNSGFTTGTFAAVPTTTTKLVDSRKNNTCTITVLLRASGLAWNSQLAGTTYIQGLTLTGLRQ